MEALAHTIDAKDKGNINDKSKQISAELAEISEISVSSAFGYI